MTVLTALRAELADLLQDAGMDVCDYVPEVVNPPVAIVSSGEPYVSETFDTKTFNHDYRVQLVIRLVAAQESNQDATASLDDMIESTLIALQGAWECDVEKPFLYEVHGDVYLATDVSISTSITIA